MGGYAEDMRAFNEWVLDHRLSPTERLLYHRIRWFFDRAGDPKKLAIKSINLMEMEDLTQSTFNRARKKLEAEGLILTETHRGQETLYEFLPIVKDGLRGQSNGQSNGQSAELRAGAHAREDTYVPIRGINNNIYYNSSLSRNLSGNSRGGTGEEAGERPDINQVEDYVRRTGLNVDVKLFMSLNDAAGWRDGNGQPIRNWQIWLNGFAARNPQARADRKPTAFNFEQRTYEPGELDYLFDWMRQAETDEEAAQP